MRRKVNSRYYGRKSPETEQRQERQRLLRMNEIEPRSLSKYRIQKKNEKFTIFKK